MNIHSGDRTIFPALLSDLERLLLRQLSTESGLSQSAVIRTLILKEVAGRRLHRDPLASKEAR